MKKLLNMTLALLLCCMVWTTFGAEEAAALHRGIDVSQWQGNIDYRKVRGSGVRAVYIKAGEGDGWVDPYFEKNYRRARQNRMHIGFYHYVTARTVSQGRRQAHFFATLLNEKDMYCRPAMDFEQVSGLSKEQANRIALAYLRELHRLTGYRPVVYSDDYDAETLWQSALSRYPLWIADYRRGSPSDMGGWRRWEGFQHSDKGQVPGISGMVDLDYFRDGMYLSPSERYKERPVVHYVKKGQGLREIARLYNTTELSLVELNRIDYPFILYTGNKLIVKKGRGKEK